MTYDFGNIRGLMDGMYAVIALPDGEAEKAAAEMMDAYEAHMRENGVDEKIRSNARSVCEQNVGYCTGYMSAEQMRRAQEVFATAHPVFGSAVPRPEEALEAGIARGETFDAFEEGRLTPSDLDG
jgi:hypothetical protein